MHIVKYVHTTIKNGVINMSEVKIDKEKNEAMTETERSNNRDLANRERVNFVVKSSIMRELRTVSKKKEIPMSRIIDNALMEYLKVGTAKRQVNPFMENGDVLLYHLLEIIIYERIEKIMRTTFYECIEQCFTNHISTSAVLNLESDHETTVGTKVFTFLRDQDNDSFVEFLEEAFCKYEDIKIQIILDGKEIKFDKAKL